ncbi:recombinase family protein [Nocardia cyriacigeorgica]|uniref:recombinase family protein n=1 Tax=Nocardia cyriacigeorgica TaxID=135487 RepID=UPI0013D67B57|nr:recombinase family protein [Nocardia cyriacigeorgica]NEW29478.1 recombinase family protein [Nocardia cyriacigeorgica]
MSDQGKRARIYARVSQDSTGEARSVAEQVAECTAECERQGWLIAGIYTDNDIGASRHTNGRKHRPGFESLKQELQPGDVLVTWESSRVTRELGTYNELRELCSSRGVSWSYKGRIYDLSNSSDRFITGLDVLSAERYADELKERVQRAMNANLVAGKPHGKPPYGYKATYGDAGVFLNWVIVPDQAEVIRGAADTMLNGGSLSAYAKDLNARGVPAPSGGKWDHTIIRRVLLNPSTAGFRTHYRKISGRGTWEPIITEEEHYRLVGLLTNPVRLKHRGTDPKNICSLIAVCGVCGGKVRSKTNRGIQYYSCKENSCKGVWRAVHYVDPIVKETVLLWLERFNVGEFIRRQGSTDISSIVDEVNSVRGRLVELESEFEAGNVSAAAFGRLERKLLDRISDLESGLAGSVLPVGVIEAAGPDARGYWEGLTVRARKSLVKAVVEPVLLPFSGRVSSLRPELIEFRWTYT